MIERGFNPSQDVLVIQQDVGYMIVLPTALGNVPVYSQEWEAAQWDLREVLNDFDRKFTGGTRVFVLPQGGRCLEELRSGEYGVFDEPDRKVA